MLLTSLLLILRLSYSASDEVLSPQNVSVRWKSDFDPEFSWVPPKPNCSYEVMIMTGEPNSENSDTTHVPTYSTSLSMGGGKLFFYVTTICGGNTSSPVNLNVTYPDLVSDLRCIGISETVCSWQPSGGFSDLQFFFRFMKETGGLSTLEECPSYVIVGGRKTGCSLPPVTEILHVLLNSTGREGVIRNTFYFGILPVSPPPLNMTVIPHEDKFVINWTTPKILPLNFWTFHINYTVCNKVDDRHFRKVASVTMNRVPHCQYRLSVRAENPRGNSGWSKPVYIDALTVVDPLVYLVAIPVVLSALMVVALVCYSKHHDVLLPKVPAPKNLLDSNRNKVCDRFIPAEEERICDVLIVQDSNTTCNACDGFKDS